MKRDYQLSKFRFLASLVALMGFSLLLGSTAQAQATRTWVSGVGDDANPCSRTAPCKTFAGAISKTAAGGEINIIDPGGFGAVTITKSITIDGGGSFGSILAAGTNGIIINAGVNDTVNIRNLSINGIGTGLNGIRFLAGRTLNVENCVIANVTTHGIDVSMTTAGEVLVKDTQIRNCGNSGISSTTTSGTPLQISLENVKIQRCATGLNALNGTRATMRNCTITHNTTGLIATSATGNSQVNCESNVFSSNTTAIQSGTGAVTVRISNNFIVGNGTGLFVNGGAILSFNNNKINGNTTNGAPTASAAQS